MPGRRTHLCKRRDSDLFLREGSFSPRGTEMPEKAIPVEAEFTLFKKNMKGAKVRGAPRYRCALATLGRLILPETSTVTDVWINNLSKNGIGLNVEQAIEEQTPVVIHLKNSSKSF